MYKRDKLTKYSKEFSAVDYIHDYGLDPEKREIYLFSREEFADKQGVDDVEEPGVEYSLANQLIKNIRILASLSDDSILIHMKSNGGDCTEGMAIYDAIITCPIPVTILNYTHARSMTSTILQAADWRVMMPHSTFMFHEGDSTASGTWKQVLTEMEHQTEQKRQMDEVYIDKLVILRACV